MIKNLKIPLVTSLSSSGLGFFSFLQAAMQALMRTGLDQNSSGISRTSLIALSIYAKERQPFAFISIFEKIAALALTSSGLSVTGIFAAFCLRFYYELWEDFDRIDVDNERRISEKEFTTGYHILNEDYNLKITNPHETFEILL